MWLVGVFNTPEGFHDLVRWANWKENYRHFAGSSDRPAHPIACDEFLKPFGACLEDTKWPYGDTAHGYLICALGGSGCAQVCLVGLSAHSGVSVLHLVPMEASLQLDGGKGQLVEASLTGEMLSHDDYSTPYDPPVKMCKLDHLLEITGIDSNDYYSLDDDYVSDVSAPAMQLKHLWPRRDRETLDNPYRRAGKYYLATLLQHYFPPPCPGAHRAVAVFEAADNRSCCLQLEFSPIQSWISQRFQSVSCMDTNVRLSTISTSAKVATPS
ncbi:hypothetical protein EDC04DRAFT_2605417 [Pisolithus marmoratus]|nr:hypothetical protein EDC04DRAFT_2605417 [Pisolithus marmoratus]